MSATRANTRRGGSKIILNIFQIVSLVPSVAGSGTDIYLMGHALTNVTVAEDYTTAVTRIAEVLPPPSMTWG